MLDQRIFETPPLEITHETTYNELWDKFTNLPYTQNGIIVPVRSKDNGTFYVYKRASTDEDKMPGGELYLLQKAPDSFVPCYLPEVLNFVLKPEVMGDVDARNSMILELKRLGVIDNGFNPESGISRFNGVKILEKKGSSYVPAYEIF